MRDLSRILRAIDAGDQQAASQLFLLVYDELRQLAAIRLAEEHAEQSLEPTALVHEVYLRVIAADPDYTWEGKTHFFMAAAEAMRRILIERARRRKRVKHGGKQTRVPVDLDQLPYDEADHLLGIDDALEQLAKQDPRVVELVKLRFYGGMTMREVANALAISERQASRMWAYARAWLYQHLNP